MRVQGKVSKPAAKQVTLVLSLLLVACTDELRFFTSTSLAGSSSGPEPSGGNGGTPAGGTASAGESGEAGTAAGGSAQGMADEPDAAIVPVDAAVTLDAAGDAATGPIGPAGDWQITFEETCDGALNPSWITYWMAPNMTRTQPHTAEEVLDERVTVEDGSCVIMADNTPTGQRSHSSGTLNTAGKLEQQYGYFEARIQAPRGVGVWMDWRLHSTFSWPPAIDVGLVFGRRTDQVRFAHYYGAPFPNHSQWQDTFATEDLSLGFHVYGVEWTAAEIIWYLDGVERARTGQSVDQQTDPLHLTLGLLVGTGKAPSEPPDGTTQWPQFMRIDWVRAWQRPPPP